MQQKYYDAASGQEQGSSSTPDIGKLLDMLKEKLSGLTQPIIPTKRKEQVEGQERAAESPEARPAPTPTPKKGTVQPKSGKKHDGWVDAGYGNDPNGPLNAQGEQWQGAPPVPTTSRPSKRDPNPVPKPPTPTTTGPGQVPPVGGEAPPVVEPPLPAPPGQPPGAGGKGAPPMGGPPVPGPGPVGPPTRQGGPAGRGNLAEQIGASAVKKPKGPAAPPFRPPGFDPKG